MYSGKLHQSIIQSSHNLKNLYKRHDYSMQKYKTLANQLSEGCKRNPILNELISLLRDHLTSVPRNLQHESSSLLRVWTHQCECVVAQRIRRGQQMFSLYSRLWDEQALRHFLSNVRKQVTRHGKEFIYGAVGVSAYNWNQHRIPDDEMRSHFPEMEYAKMLKSKTVMCRVCNTPDNLNKSVIMFCNCEERKTTLNTFDNWTLMIEQDDLIVWRRTRPNGIYEYKVYGTYNDVTTEDFLAVQIDTQYRKLWDQTAVVLEVIENDATPGSNSDLIYWEMQWPTLFSNRDYVFNRRYLVDEHQKTAVVLNKCSSHPNYPSKPNKHRVEEYFSSMVIKPYTEINKLGVEFSLTYFDNPGVNIPQSITSWVAYRVMPDFLTRLRSAAKKYKTYCSQNKCDSVYSFRPKPQPQSNDMDERRQEVDLDDYSLLDAIGDNAIDYEEPPARIVHNERLNRKDQPRVEPEHEPPPPTLSPSSVPGAEVILAPTPIIQNDQTYWKYLHPTYYIS